MLTEFVKMVSSQANEVCTGDKKTTVTPEHVLEALKQLDLAMWTDDVKQAWVEYKDSAKGTALLLPCMPRCLDGRR